jgi:hypothetical protein
MSEGGGRGGDTGRAYSDMIVLRSCSLMGNLKDSFGCRDERKEEIGFDRDDIDVDVMIIDNLRLLGRGGMTKPTDAHSEGERTWMSYLLCPLDSRNHFVRNLEA